MKLNQIASEERSGLSSAQTENPFLSALADGLQEINLRVGRLQEASAVTARKSGRDRGTNALPVTSSPGEMPQASILLPSSPRPGGRHVHFRESTLRDNYAAPRHSKEKWRLVLDFRKLNEITVTQDFVIPTLDDILHEISGSNYFSALDMKRYIKNFAKRALPLTNLLRKDTPFEWTSETQEAFDDIKKAILNPPVLALPDQNAELQITTDASSRGIGAVLEQKYPNSERFSYLHLKNLDDLQPDETEVKGIVPSPRYNLRARAELLERTEDELVLWIEIWAVMGMFENLPAELPLQCLPHCSHMRRSIILKNDNPTGQQASSEDLVILSQFMQWDKIPNSIDSGTIWRHP
ncbi:transposon Tf2-9 polyprotein [Trichonephila clavipes]|nr:transposon Tf2-9 polyprotein [Trichonephila clavipes]